MRCVIVYSLYRALRHSRVCRHFWQLWVRGPIILILSYVFYELFQQMEATRPVDSPHTIVKRKLRPKHKWKKCDFAALGATLCPFLLYELAQLLWLHLLVEVWSLSVIYCTPPMFGCLQAFDCHILVAKPFICQLKALLPECISLDTIFSIFPAISNFSTWKPTLLVLTYKPFMASLVRKVISLWIEGNFLFANFLRNETQTLFC